MTDLTGVWDGTYAYPSALQPVPFRAELRDHDGRLSGEVSEPAPAYLPPGELVAIVTGARSARHVRFTKIYDTLEHFRDPVVYDGTLDEDECEIAGRWTIGPGWSGTFVMTRPKLAEAETEEEAEQEVEEPVELDR